MPEYTKAHAHQQISTNAPALIYGYRTNGAMGAPSGFHDDVVMAHAIAVYIAGLPDAAHNALTFFADLERLQE